MTTKELNVVTCGQCGGVFAHVRSVEELHCPYCSHHSDVCDFPDLYCQPEYKDSIITIEKGAQKIIDILEEFSVKLNKIYEHK